MTFDYIPGELKISDHVLELIDENSQFTRFVLICLNRFGMGDFGDVGHDEFWDFHEESVMTNGRLLGVYKIPLEIEEVFEDRIWIISDHDRSATIIRFPGDY